MKGGAEGREVGGGATDAQFALSAVSLAATMRRPSGRSIASQSIHTAPFALGVKVNFVPPTPSGIETRGADSAHALYFDHGASRRIRATVLARGRSSGCTLRFSSG
jgi:hypothetical protein